ncbi:TetR/AcrR family transcriptional regulator [Phocaeicola sp.]
MNSVNKRRTDKTVVKEHVVAAAAKAFMEKGVKTVRMDDIAAGLSISKRTLYELFHDKEDLLLDVVKLHREEMQKYMEGIASKAENVLEVILCFYQRSAQDFQNTNRKFFEDMEKYPKVVAYIAESRRENLDAAMEFYQKGVNQGIFRKEVNYDIVRAMVSEQMDILVSSELCKSYSLAEIYETVVFMHMRGISTEKGLKIVDDFLQNLKGNEHNENG